MRDESKTKRQLIKELDYLRRQMVDLESAAETSAQMKDSHEKFMKSFLQTSIPMGLTTLKEGRFVEVNEAFLKLMGLKRNEVIGKTSRGIGFITEEKRSMLFEELNKKGRVENFELQVHTKGGALCQGLFNAVMMTHNNEKYLLTVMMDITDRKRTEEALRKTEEEYRDLLSHINDGVYRLNNDGYFTFVNKVIVDRSGFSPEKFRNLHYLDIVAPDARERVASNFEKVMKGESVAPYELNYRTADGRTITVEVNSRAIYEGNSIVGLQGISRDVTQRKQLEDVIEAGEKWFQRLIESIPVGIFIYEGTKIRYLNSACEKMTGYTQDELYLFDVWDIAHPEYKDSIREYVQRRQQNEPVPERHVFKIITKSGQERWLERYSTALELKEKLYVLITIMDITERKLAEEALQESEALYRTLVETSPDAIVMYSLSGEILTANNQAARVYGASNVAEFLLEVRSVFDLLSEEGKTFAVANFRRTLSDGYSRKNEYLVCNRKGQTIPTEINSAVVWRATAEPQAFISVIRDISERKQAEGVLQESEARLSRAQEIAHLGNWEYDTETGRIAWSDEAYRIYGFVPQKVEITSELILSMIHPDDRNKVETAFRDVQDGFGQHNIEYRIILKNGAVRHVHSQRDVSNAEEDPVRIFGTLQDITERKRVEKALRESEIKYRTIFESFEDIYYQTDQNGMITIISPSVYRVSGWKPEELIGQPATMVYAEPGDRVALLEALSEHGYVRDYELTLLMRDGSKAMASLSARLIYDSGGAPAGLAGSLRNITDRKRVEQEIRNKNMELTAAYEQLAASGKEIVQKYLYLAKSQQALSESEKKFRDLAELLPQVVFEFDLQGRFTYVNRFAFDLFGYSQADLAKGLNALDMIASFDRERAALDILRIIEKEKETGTEYTAVRKNGEEFPVIIYSTPIHADGKVIGLRGIVVDISERKKLEERLSRAEKMEALGTLAGGVAHDLNNVLGVLVGYSELLAEKLPPESPLRRYADNILQSGIRGAAIIQDLLTLARRSVSVSEVIDLNRVIRDYFKTPEFESLRDHHWQVKFSTDLEAGLLNIQGSPVHLGKAIMNLVSNAAESISGKGEVTIQTRNRYLDQPIRGYDEMQEGDYVVLTVSDTGMGISAEDLGKIFEPFYTKKVMGRSGTGLGLAVVWGTVKDHDGYIDVQSEADKGSVFTLYFPVTREKAAEAEQIVSSTAYMGRGESILVVDDVQEQRELAVSMLERLGYRVEVVSGGEEAVERLKRRKADLVVLDMIMDPGIDGMETYRRILEMNPGQKAVIVSGFSETDRVRKTREMGAGAFVRKPYILEKIALAVRKELDRK